ncbi:MAG TPA: acyl-CoA dehydrogenase family protein [Candidatus Binataceae bacterium]|nr:acyl-CoA dehydrogenase family protein [Candidatus Binataceae bacterium]
MDFDLNENQQELRSALRSLFEGACDIRHVRQVAYDGDGRDPALWKALSEGGWTALMVPEAEGGSGLRFEDFIVLLEESGRAVAPVPLSTTLLAGRLIANAPAGPARSDTLRQIAAGTASFTLALGEGVKAEATGGNWRLDGKLEFVPYGPLAATVLVEAALLDGKRGLFALPTDATGVKWLDLDVMDRTVRQHEMTLSNASVAAAASIFGTADASAAIQILVDEWRAALAAESLGVAEKMIELSVAYVKERVQFGKPVGSNQAVKVRIAEMGAVIDRLRSAVYYAAWAIDSNVPERKVAIAMAKAAASGPGAFVGTQAIHVHGGIGFTWEYDLHLYFKRIKSNELLLGDTSAALQQIADEVL